MTLVYCQQVHMLTEMLDRTRSKVSVTCEALITYCENFVEYDGFLASPCPTNPWISDEDEFWLLNEDR